MRNAWRGDNSEPLQLSDVLMSPIDGEEKTEQTDEQIVCVLGMFTGAVNGK